MSTQAHVGALEPHVPNSETVLEWFANDEQTIAVTDRRVVDMTRTGSENEHRTLVESTLLGENVVGTEYRREMESKFDVAQIAVGVLLGLIGLYLGWTGITGGGEDAMIGLVLGVCSWSLAPYC